MLYVSKSIINWLKNWIISSIFSFSYSMIQCCIFLLKFDLIRNWKYLFSNFLIESLFFWNVWLMNQQSIFSHTKYFFWREKLDLNNLCWFVLRDWKKRSRSRIFDFFFIITIDVICFIFNFIFFLFIIFVKLHVNFVREKSVHRFVINDQIL